MIRDKCLVCHFDGGPGPFPLETYKEVRAKSELIKFQALSKLMPPVYGRSDYGDLAHVEGVTDREAVVYQEWLRAGMPEGEGVVLPAKAATPFSGDIVVAAQDLGTVKEEGARYWKVFSVSIPKEIEDLNAFSIVPDSPKVFREAQVAAVPASFLRGKPFSWETAGTMDVPAGSMVGQWAPAYPAWHMPGNAGLKMPKDGKFLVMVQYQPLGKPVSAGFKLILRGGAKSGAYWADFHNDSFEIPADTNPKIRFSYTLPKNGELVSLIPEARFYCAAVFVDAKFPDGTTKEVYATERWDPYWVPNVQFAEGAKFPKGTVITARFEYGNDQRCGMNEGRIPAKVFVGPGVDQEVCRFHLLWLPDSK